MATKEKDKAALKWGVDEDKPVKVDKWDGGAVKNALDDQTKKVLEKRFGYVESHALMNGRLIICTVAVSFALFALLWDYLFPFPKSRPVLITCVLSYFFMMVILTIYTSIKEKGCFMVALEKDKAGIDPDNVWTCFSHMKRYDDQYELCITFRDGITSATRSKSVTKSVANFFDENGYICTDIFDAEVARLHSDLSSERKDK